MLNWETAIGAEICGNMSQILWRLREGRPQNVSMSYYMPARHYRLLSFEKRMTRIQKGPGKGRNRIVYVMRKG